MASASGSPRKSRAGFSVDVVVRLVSLVLVVPAVLAGGRQGRPGRAGRRGYLERLAEDGAERDVPGEAHVLVRVVHPGLRHFAGLHEVLVGVVVAQPVRRDRVLP